MTLLVVLLDACVLFSAPLRDTLLRAADAGLYHLVWSEQILEELRRNLISTKRATEAQARHLLDEMTRYFPEAAVTGYQHIVPLMTNHEGDRHVLAAAHVSGSQVIVTHNLRHFPDDALEPYGIEAQAPDEFLTNLFDLAPALIVEIIGQQAASLTRPAATVEGVLDKLQRDAPGFVVRVRMHLHSQQA